MGARYTSARERFAAAAARRVAKKLAKQLHVSITERLDGGWHELLLTAPDKHRFKNSELHELVIANAGPTTDQLWQRALTELRYEADVETCPDADCEWCNS